MDRTTSRHHHAMRSKRWTTHVERSASRQPRREVVTSSRRAAASSSASSTAAAAAASGGGGVAPADSTSYDEYVHNLQQQIYFLELESQLLKQGQQAAGSGGDAHAHGGHHTHSADHSHTTHSSHDVSHASGGGGGGASASGAHRGSAAGGSSGGGGQRPGSAPPFSSGVDDGTGEFDDIFTQFKSRYSRMEQQYKAEAEENRKTMEALRTQLEAHGALVEQLKTEITRRSEVHAAERQAWNEQQEATLTAHGVLERRCRNLTDDLAAVRKAQEDLETAAHAEQDKLQETVATLKSELAEAGERAVGQERAIADVTHKLKRREDEILVLQRHLQAAEAKAPPLEDALAQVSQERDEAVAAQRTAELSRKATESAMQRLEAETAAVVQRLGEAEGVIQRLESQLSRTATTSEHHAMAREEAEVRLLLTAQRADEADTARRVAEHTSAAAKDRATSVQRELAAAVSVIERLRSGLDAEKRKSQALGKDLNASSQAAIELEARVQTLDDQLAQAAARESALEEVVTKETQTRVTVESELASARRELMGKPDTAPLQQIDFNELLHKNIEAATTIEAFIKESQEREAKVEAELASPLPRRGGSRAVTTTTTTTKTSRWAGRSTAAAPTPATATAAASSPSAAPLVDSPARTSLPAGQARAQLLGHTAAVPAVTSGASAPSTTAGAGAGSGGGARQASTSTTQGGWS